MTGRSTADFLTAADVCLTTSITEGFGMAFLEPWLADRAVIGRDLPSSTADFREAGVVLEDLYRRLEVKVENRTEVESTIGAAVTALCEAYRVAITAGFIREAVASVFHETQADFGRLNEDTQEAVIRRVVAGKLKVALPQASGGKERIVNNRRRIEESYSLESYGWRLKTLYGNLAEANGIATGHLDAGKVLRANLNFEDFFALRT